MPPRLRATRARPRLRRRRNDRNGTDRVSRRVLPLHESAGQRGEEDAIQSVQSEETILHYRKAVQAFVRFVLARAYETVRHHSRPNALKGTRREYLLVRTVDEKLERLVVDVLRNQMEQIELLRRIEEINGLLVDLLT